MGKFSKANGSKLLIVVDPFANRYKAHVRPAALMAHQTSWTSLYSPKIGLSPILRLS